MKSVYRFLGMAALVVAAGIARPALAGQDDSVRPSPRDFAPKLVFTTPQSSIERPEDLGLRMHTNFVYFKTGIAPDAGAPYGGYLYETPASLACVYKLVAVTFGCDPNRVTTNSAKGSKVIAIVDAYDDPVALHDLKAYSKQFGLPAPTAATFEVVYASGTKPPVDETYGWESEESLDIEMAHAIAPKAKVILVEADSNSDADLETAVKKARSLVIAAGGGEVSMSYGGGEYSGETSGDSIYFGNKVVYFASAGDSAGVEYPSASPNVVAVGGTALRRNPSDGTYLAQAVWEDTGGGLSAYETIPAYQSSISSIVGKSRGVPDISAVADPNTGVWVYDSNDNNTATPWFIFGGTSVASPLAAAVVNAAGHFEASTKAEEKLIYAGTASEYTDVTLGFCGPGDSYVAKAGWDPCTGRGVPTGLAGK